MIHHPRTRLSGSCLTCMFQAIIYRLHLAYYVTPFRIAIIPVSTFIDNMGLYTSWNLDFNPHVNSRKSIETAALSIEHSLDTNMSPTELSTAEKKYTADPEDTLQSQQRRKYLCLQHNGRPQPNISSKYNTKHTSLLPFTR